MKIEIQDLSKRYQEQWIIHGLSDSIDHGSICSIKGDNGSGKSTLIKLISGYLTPTKGSITYETVDGEDVPRDSIAAYTSLAGPYISFEQNFTLVEIFDYLSRMRSFESSNADEFLQKCELDHVSGKYLGQLSDGMQQRFNLMVALDINSQLLLLDEPTSFLDKKYKTWFYNHVEKYLQKRTICIASNDESDFRFSSYEINSKYFTKNR